MNNETWQVIGIVKRKSKTGAIYTTLHLIGQHDKYSVDNAEVCQGSRVMTETTAHDLPPVTIGDEIELLYAKGFEDKEINLCFEDVKQSGAIIHTIALGPSAAKELETLSNMTGKPLK